MRLSLILYFLQKISKINKRSPTFILESRVAKPKRKDPKKTFLITFYFSLGVKVGKANGLRLLLDAETFDYTFHKSASEGFKMAVQHHLDQPLMSVKELDIAPGFETQIAVSPLLYSTTKEALHRFKPEERGCYSEEELTFKYLPKSLYRQGYLTSFKVRIF